MKVLMLSKYFAPVFGGLETVVYELLLGLTNAGVLTDVLCCSLSHKTSIEKHTESGAAYTVFRAGTLTNIAKTSISISLIYLLNMIKKKYDIIQVHMPDPMAALALFLTRPKAKIVVHWHSDVINHDQLYLIYSHLELWILRRADVIIVTSKNYLYSSEILKLYRDKVQVIPSGMDVSYLDVKSDDIIRVKEKYDNRKIVFSLGRMTEYKGFNYLIDAASLLNDNYICLVGGSGHLLEIYKRDVKIRGLDKKIIFLGPLTDAEAKTLFCACDLFCLPSILRSEAFGMVILEALAAKKAIVATDIIGSGVPWVNQHMLTGLNVEPKSAIALAEAISTICNDNNLRACFEANAVQRYENFFLRRYMIDKFIKLYQDLLDIKIQTGD